MSLVQVRQTGNVREITLSRPEAGNALSGALVGALQETVDEIGPETCDTVVFRGAGKGFCGGFDLTDLAHETDASLLQRFVRIELLLQDIVRLPQETVAMAHRFAFGAGADIFIACDTRIAAPGTKFAFPGVRFGIALGSRRLAMALGSTTARRLLSAPAPIDCETARACGLVSGCLPEDGWAEELERRAAQTMPLCGAIGQLVRARLDGNDHDGDLAALVRSAAVPGLKARMETYKAETDAARRRGR